MTLRAGRPVHSGRIDSLARNVGSANWAEFATYVVEKGKPLVEMASA